MLYNYYMKKFSAILSVLCCLALTAQAEMTVVRVDGKKVFLDTSEEKTSLTKGTTFKVILSSEKLINPKTGKDLGEVYRYSELGTVTEVQSLYAIGEVPNTTGIIVGKTAVLEEVKPVPTTDGAQSAPKSTRSVTTYQPIEQTIISLTQADVTAPGAQNIVTLSAKNQVTVFSRAGKETLRPELSFTLPEGKKGIVISAAPLKEGLAQIFVSVYQPDRAQISTLVLENKDGKLEIVATLPYFVKELGCGDTKKIWGQRPFVLNETPGNAREIVFEKDKFVASGSSFNTRHNWLEGLTYYPVEKANQNNLIFTTSNGKIRMQLANGKIVESKDLFGSTPLRTTYKQTILKFFPSIQAYGAAEEASIVAIENGTKLGLLSETFGQYQDGKIHFLKYEKGRLQVVDTVELAGVLYDTACTDRAILTAEALPNDTSSIVEILK